ncbi:hypothetical protein B0O80DRAFT_427660 [Mortierella sp. GBAus27b]|nr:hypothetical protein B0O80DRAFT_427660 [Mortierella sp. GBAus27b]
MEHNHQVRKRGGGRGRGGNTTNGHANHGNHQNNGNNATGFTNNNPRGRGAPQNTNARGRGRGTRGRGGPFVGGQVPEHANGHGQYQPQRARGAKRSRVNNKNRSPPSIEIIPDSSDEDNGSIHSYNSDKGEGYSDLEDSEPGEGGSDLIGVVRRSAGATVLRESRSATPPPSSTNTRWRELKHDLFMNDLPGISAPDVVNGVAPKRLETITSYITIYKTTICDKISELETYIDLLNQISAVDQQFWTTHSPFLVSLLRFHLGLLRKARDIQDIKSKYRYFVMGTLAVLKWDPKYTKLKRKLDQIRRKSTDQENLPSPTQIRALFDDQTDDFALSDNPATTRPTITTNGNVTTSSSASPMDIELPSALSPSSPPPFSTDLGKRRADSPPPQHVKVESRVQGSSCPFAPGYSAGKLLLFK